MNSSKINSLQEWRSGKLPSIAETNKAYPTHLPPVTALDYESRIQKSLKKTVVSSRLKYTMSVFRISSIILGSVMATVYAANAIIVYDKETYLEELIRKRDGLL